MSGYDKAAARMAGLTDLEPEEDGGIVQAAGPLLLTGMTGDAGTGDAVDGEGDGEGDGQDTAADAAGAMAADADEASEDDASGIVAAAAGETSEDGDGESFGEEPATDISAAADDLDGDRETGARKTETEPLRKPSRPAEPARRRPRVALMGEFSAGKSTLSNLLIGATALPVNVTATQLPPVWISHGSDTPYRVSLDGDEYDIDLNRLADVSVDDTNHIRIFRDAKLLEICDLIDMPGISDPNMAAAVWQRVIHNADIVLWCSHATQAWRQSEAAVWATMPRELYSKSLLLLTRMDKILSERDRERVIRRVEKETRGLFRQVLPVSLIKALDAGEDSEAFAASGAAALTETLVDLIDEVAGQPPKSRIRSRLAPTVEEAIGEEIAPVKPRVVMPTRIRPRPLTTRPVSRGAPRGEDARSF